MKTPMLIFGLCLVSVVPARAGWISTFATLDAADSADKAAKNTQDISNKMSVLIDLMKEDHQRINALEVQVKKLTPKPKLAPLRGKE